MALCIVQKTPLSFPRDETIVADLDLYLADKKRNEVLQQQRQHEQYPLSSTTEIESSDAHSSSFMTVRSVSHSSDTSMDNFDASTDNLGTPIDNFGASIDDVAALSSDFTMHDSPPLAPLEFVRHNDDSDEFVNSETMLRGPSPDSSQHVDLLKNSPISPMFGEMNGVQMIDDYQFREFDSSRHSSPFPFRQVSDTGTMFNDNLPLQLSKNGIPIFDNDSDQSQVFLSVLFKSHAHNAHPCTVHHALPLLGSFCACVKGSCPCGDALARVVLLSAQQTRSELVVSQGL